MPKYDTIQDLLTKKIKSPSSLQGTLEDGLNRIRTYAYRLENSRAMKAYGTPSVIGKCVILAHEKNEGRVTLILVNEAPGY